MPLGRELAAANRREVVASQTCAKRTAAAGAASRAGGCTRSAQGTTDYCIGHGERCKGRRFNIDGTSEPCTRAGPLDKVAGSLLCAAHAEHGLVPASEARALIRTALGRSTPLPPDLSLWNCLGAKGGGLGQLTGDELTAVLRVCDIELQRRCTESPGNLTRCRTALSKMLPPSALEMLTAPALMWLLSETKLERSSTSWIRTTK